MESTQRGMYQNAYDKLSLTEINILQDIQRFFILERIQRNWTQRQMADELGISQSSVSRLENGQYQSFNLGFLLGLVQKLNYEPHIIFMRPDESFDEKK